MKHAVSPCGLGTDQISRIKARDIDDNGRLVLSIDTTAPDVHGSDLLSPTCDITGFRQ